MVTLSKEDKAYLRSVGFDPLDSGGWLRRNDAPPGYGLFQYVLPYHAGGWIARRGPWQGAAQPDAVTAFAAAEVDNWGQ